MRIPQWLYAMYLGFSLKAFGGISFDELRFYAIIIPVVVFVSFSQESK